MTGEVSRYPKQLAAGHTDADLVGDHGGLQGTWRDREGGDLVQDVTGLTLKHQGFRLKHRILW